MTIETKATWGGPSIPTPIGVELAACTLCRRHLKHTWREHVTQIHSASDPLGQAAGLPQGDAA